jgi:hypothetical protein
MAAARAQRETRAPGNVYRSPRVRYTSCRNPKPEYRNAMTQAAHELVLELALDAPKEKLYRSKNL